MMLTETREHKVKENKPDIVSSHSSLNHPCTLIDKMQVRHRTSFSKNEQI